MASVNPPALPHQKAAPIKWTEEDWIKISTYLMSLYPERNFGTAERFQLSMPELVDAIAKVFDPEKRRSVANTADFKPTLSKWFKKLRVEHVDHTETPPAPAVPLLPYAPLEKPSFEIPEFSQVEHQAQPPAVTQVQPQEQLQSERKHTKVFWDTRDWYKIAKEIVRLAPFENFLKSSSLAGLSLALFKEAERNVIEHDRRRPSINTVAAIRTDLMKAFDKVREEAEVERKFAEEQERIAAEKRLQQEEEERKQREEALANPYERAFAPLLAPLVHLLAAEVAKAIIPMLENVKIVAERTDNQHQVHEVVIAPPKQRKPRIGLVGGNPNQQNDVEQAFPQFEFIKVPMHEKQGTNAENVVRNCEKVIVMTSFIEHQTDARVKKVVGGRYCPVEGGSSAVKRYINRVLLPEGLGSSQGQQQTVH